MYSRFYVKQINDNDCGCACLLMIFKIFNINAKYNVLKKQLKTDDDGTSIYNILKVSNKYNLKAEAYKKLELDDINKPAIIHIIKENNISHFVVLLKKYKNKVLVADPALGVISLDKKELNNKYTKVAILFSKNELFMKYIIDNKKIISKLIIMTLLLTLFSLLFSFMLSFFIDEILKYNHYKINNFYFIMFLLLGLLSSYLNHKRDKIAIKFEIILNNNIIKPIIDKIIFLPQKFYQNNSSAEVLSKINDLNYIKELAVKFVDIVLVNLIFITISLFILVYHNIYFLFLNIIMFILFYYFGKLFLKKDLYYYYDLQLKNEELNNTINDNIQKIDKIHYLSKEVFFLDKINKSYNNYVTSYEKSFSSFEKKNYFFSIISTFIEVISIMILLFCKTKLHLIIFLFSIEMIILNSLKDIVKIIPLYSEFKSCLTRIKDILKYEKVLLNNKNIIINKIVYKNFSYKYNNKFVLRNINFEINKGDYIMVCGPSGSGKTTMFKSLIKYIKTDNILINNSKISRYDLSTLKNSILYMDNKIKLFNDTIKNNVFFEEEIDDKVLKTSVLDKTLKDNNIDLNYIVNKDNSNLSNGQISKIQIASCLALNRQILIFDELTSSLDETEERIILNNIKKSYKNITLILITHRKSNDDLFDKIIYLNKGKIKERMINEKVKYLWTKKY